MLFSAVFGEGGKSSYHQFVANGILYRCLGIVADPGYVLALPLKGTIKEPVVDWAAASNDLGRLALERVGGMISGEQGTLTGLMRNTFLDVAKNMSGGKPKQAAVPKLTEPLPWK